MSLPKTMLPAETIDLEDLAPLVLDETLVKLTVAPLRPVLPARIAVVGNYFPRQCGIATFTADLCDAIHSEYAATELLAIPVNDTEEGYAYPARVRFELSEDLNASTTSACAIHAPHSLRKTRKKRSTGFLL
jgi:hypothetical protein